MSAAGRLRVLYINDKPEDPGLERELIAAGHAVRAVQSAEHVGRLLQICPVDLVIVDVWQPAMLALGVCRSLRTQLQRARVPLVLVLAAEDRDLRVTAERAGVDEFLYRPTLVGDLRELLADLIALRARPQAAIEPATIRLPRVEV